MIDTIIAGAEIYDGTTRSARRTDLAIVGERIALIGDLSERDAHQRIDGAACALTPGFIDVHSHSDELWLVNGRCEGKIMQGVTTEIGGNCGTSIAPLQGLALERKREDVRTLRAEVEWQDLSTFFSLIERNGIALNVATLIGLGTTRRCVHGDLEGKLSETQARAQLALVREGIEQGGLGISSGLIYVPSRYADLAELSACASVAREAGAPRYVSHIRDEGDALLDAVTEALDVGRAADVAVQCSHHKAAGKKNWGKVHDSLRLIDHARAAGLVAYADVYPYIASWTDLATILPESALYGGREATLERLRNPEICASLALALDLERGDTWHDILITGGLTERNAHLAGMRMDDVAREWHQRPSRAALRLLLEEKLEPQAIFFNMNEEDVATVLSADFTCIGSDASARALHGITAQGVPHPRTYGTFPRIFGRYVRQRKTLEFADAIRKMTSLPADIFGLTNRGRIDIGAYADLVLFNPETIVDTATYERPFSYPIGINAVFVNGTAVVRNGEPTRALPGRALRNGIAS
ncbi:MAG TPA: D-aminoacylase [Candidatus Baltobacteraceae bacterium]